MFPFPFWVSVPELSLAAITVAGGSQWSVRLFRSMAGKVDKTLQATPSRDDLQKEVFYEQTLFAQLPIWDDESIYNFFDRIIILQLVYIF